MSITVIFALSSFIFASGFCLSGEIIESAKDGKWEDAATWTGGALQT